MEQIGAVLGRGMVGLLRPESQGKQTGSGDELCPKHKTRLRVRAAYGGDVMVCLDCEDESRQERDKANLVRTCHDGIGLSERLRLMTFSSFIASSDKEHKAKEDCEKYAKSVISGGPGGLILLGGVGTGKTHLAVSICKAICDEGKSAKLTSIPKIIRHIRTTWAGDGVDKWGHKLTEDEVIRSYTDFKLLVVDEVGVQYGTPAEKISISEVINERYNRMRPTVLIGNVTLSEVREFLGDRVVDRVKDDGMILVFDWESRRKLKG